MRRPRHLVALGLGVALLASACGIARPLPEVSRPTSGKHHTVLLMGDSIMDRAAPEIAATFAGLGMSATFRDESHGLAGLLQRSLITFETQEEILRRSIVQYEPDAVVFHYFGIHWDWPPLGSEEYYARWHSHSRKLTDIARAAGMAVYWVLPPIQPEHPEWQRIAFDYTFLPAYYSGGPPVGLVGWRNAFRPDNDTVWLDGKELRSTYAEDLLYPEDDEVRPVRTSDFHLTQPWGDWRAALWLAANMRPLWNNQV